MRLCLRGICCDQCLEGSEGNQQFSPPFAQTDRLQGPLVDDVAVKYRKQPGAIQEIKPLLQYQLQKDSQIYENFRVVSVPLHFNKLRERGFDQSFILAQAVAEVLRLPVLVQPISRIRDTPPQAKKNRKERAKNVHGAFLVKEVEQVRGQDILLVDDVMTTGSTVNEVARVVKRAGANRVHVFTLARA